MSQKKLFDKLQLFYIFDTCFSQKKLANFLGVMKRGWDTYIKFKVINLTYHAPTTFMDIYRQSPTFLSLTKSILLVHSMQIWTLLSSLEKIYVYLYANPSCMYQGNSQLCKTSDLVSTAPTLYSLAAQIFLLNIYHSILTVQPQAQTQTRLAQINRNLKNVN